MLADEINASLLCLDILPWSFANAYVLLRSRLSRASRARLWSRCIHDAGSYFSMRLLLLHW